MTFQLKLLQKIILTIGLICILFLYLNNKLVPLQYINSVSLCFLIHMVALVISIDLFNFLKIPFTFYFSFLSLITYGVSPFFIDKFDFQLGYLDFEIYNILNFGFIIFYLIYFSLSYNKIRNLRYKKSYILFNRYSFRKIVYIFLLFYILTQFIVIPISAFNDYVEFCFCGLIFIGFLTNRNNVIENIFLVLFISFISLKLLLTGLIYSIIYFVLYLLTIFLIYFQSSFKKLVPVLFYLSSVLLFTVLFSSVKMQYRKLNSDVTTFYDKSILIYELINQDLNFSYVSTDKRVKDGPIWRLSYPLSAFSQVTIMTPVIVPFWNGESYIVILYKIIPRFLFPDKPTENMGQIFGHRYSFLSDDNLTTSMNAPLLAEGYMNFGFVGFIFIIILMGILFSSFFYNLNFKNFGHNDLFDAISSIHLALLSVYFIQWESNFSMLIGKCLILFIIDMLFKKIVFTGN